MPSYPTPTRRREITGTLPGPSRTITVEPIRIPASPREVPRVDEPRHEPARKVDPKREPVPSR